MNSLARQKDVVAVEHAGVGEAAGTEQLRLGDLEEPDVGPIENDAGEVHVGPPDIRSEEHTSELQSQSNLVCRLLLEKKKTSNSRTTAAMTATSCSTPVDVSEWTRVTASTGVLRSASRRMSCSTAQPSVASRRMHSLP